MMNLDRIYQTDVPVSGVENLNSFGSSQEAPIGKRLLGCCDPIAVIGSLFLWGEAWSVGAVLPASFSPSVPIHSIETDAVPVQAITRQKGEYPDFGFPVPANGRGWRTPTPAKGRLVSPLHCPAPHFRRASQRGFGSVFRPTAPLRLIWPLERTGKKKKKGLVRAVEP